MEVDIHKIPHLAILQRVGREADRLGVACYAVGGFVRDIFLNRPTKDIDFVCIGQGQGIALATVLGKKVKAKVAVHRNFGTASLAYKGLELEFVAARKESYDRNSRKPIVENGTLADDQNRRDFTINALAICVNQAEFGKVLDPFDGLADLEAKILRTPLNPEETFSDDPLRMMRAARFATQLGYQIHAEAFEAMRKMATRIQIISQERVIDELQKIMVCPVPSIGYKILYSTGILHEVFPTLTDLAGVEYIGNQKHKDNFYHTLQVLDQVASKTFNQPTEKRWLRWAALLHDIGKPKSKRFVEGVGWTFHGHEEIGARMISKIFKSLRLPTDERMHYVEKLVRYHHRPVALVDEEVSDSAVRRLLFDAGDDIDDLMVLVRSDITTKNQQLVEKYLRNFEIVEEKFKVVEEKDRLRNFQPPVDGLEIMETFEIPPSQQVGIIKKAIEEAILDGMIPNEQEAARQFMLATFAHLLP